MSISGMKPLVNYHAHTWRCKHASGTEEEYVRQAIDEGFRIFGFADHSPWPYKSGFESRIRMTLAQFPDYERTVRALAEKYKEQIYIPLGLECEAFPEYFGWLRDFKAAHLDYVIMGNHYALNDENGGLYYGRCAEPAHVLDYAKNTISGLRTGLFNYLAHPDLYCRNYARFDESCAAAARDICQAAKALDIPLEYNLLGLSNRAMDDARGVLGYPCAGFWEIAAETGCKAIIGLDAHRTIEITHRDLYERAERFLAGLGLEILPVLPGLEAPAARS